MDDRKKKPVEKIDFEKWLRESFPGKTDPTDLRRKRFHISFVLIGLIGFIAVLVAAAWILPALGKGLAANQYLDFFKGVVPLLVGLVVGLIGK